MKLISHRGNNLHAPENTYISMISAYTCGADILEFDVQMTKDDILVVSHDNTINRLCNIEGDPVNIMDLTLTELRSNKYNFSAYFNPSNIEGFSYTKGRRVTPIEEFEVLIDKLPRNIEKFIELKHDGIETDERRKKVVSEFSRILRSRGLIESTVVYSKDHIVLKLMRENFPDLRTVVFDWELSGTDLIKLMISENASGLLSDVDSVLSNGQISEFGKEMAQAFENNSLEVGMILYPFRKPGILTPTEIDLLAAQKYIWAVSSDTCILYSEDQKIISLENNFLPSYKILDDSFEGTKPDTNKYSFGYAKPNEYCLVEQNDGVHVHLDEYKGEIPRRRVNDKTANDIEQLDLRATYLEKSWPYYSGGGLGIRNEIKGDFKAILEYSVKSDMKKAVTLEMAVTNINPNYHRSNRPKKQRDADPFFDPHGCPPYVGVEHDENDGYRINWNAGGDYANNRYGPSIGDGNVLTGELRLERKGNYFSTYYRNYNDAPNWICVGVICNESLNKSVFIRCVAKRWLKEGGETYLPVESNVISFNRLIITKPNHG